MLKNMTKLEKKRLRDERKRRKARKHNFITVPRKKTWVGWRTHEKPSKVVTYNLNDLEVTK